MLKQKNALIAVAVAVLLAACGGGGGGDSSPGNDPGTNPSGGNNAVQDKNVGGFMRLAQVGVNGNLFEYPEFTGTTGIYSQAKGTVAPLKTFGLRVTQDENPTTGASGNGHVGIELMDSAAGTPQQMRLVIDRVNYAIDASGNWTVSVPTTAKLFLYVKNRTGGVADMTLTGLPADLVKAIPLEQVRPGEVDPGAQVLTVDIDRAFVTAKAKASDAQKAVLDSMQQFEGTFNMNASFSALDIRYAATASAIPARLSGADITVGSETAKGSGTAGSGLKGKFSVGVDPTQPK